ncbi:MAG: glycosyltransferase family 39 protein [Planctomycetaceae bacterium]|nr:glycosyltransferase family 39 protein [Planctomycetaceae bacterium]
MEIPSASFSTGSLKRRSREFLILLVILVHVGLLAYLSTRYSPVMDEVGHFPAGLSHWQLNRFDLYNVNPPLVRTVAAFPAFLAGEPMNFTGYEVLPRNRPEFGIGLHWMVAHPDRVMPNYQWARWMCLSFSLVGAIACFLWGRDLYGPGAGLVALCLWCFSPMVLGHASLITPDAGAAAVGVAACYVYWRWLRNSGWRSAALAGALLGLTLLTKFTWVILPVIWALSWLVFRLGWLFSPDQNEPRPNHTTADPNSDDSPAPSLSNPSSGIRSQKPQFRQLCFILFIGWWVFCNGYLWEGVFQTLGSYQFFSQSMGGAGVRENGGNRFHGTFLEDIPVPLPRNVLQGIDHLKWEFERGYPSYLRGVKRNGGWWYYYLYGMLVKMPVGTLLLIAIAFAKCLYQFSIDILRRGDPPPRTEDEEKWKFDTLYLLIPPVSLLFLVSSQTGFNHHLRYVLPAFPFLFIFAGRVVPRGHSIAGPRFPGQIAPLCVLATVISSLLVFPHSQSYFNEPSGGSLNGWRHLDFSNIDWGQDLILAREWVDEHPEAAPLFVQSSGLVPAKVFGIECEDASRLSLGTGEGKQKWPSGWYILGLTHLVDPELPIHDFLKTEPVDYIGYSMRVYYVP